MELEVKHLEECESNSLLFCQGGTCAGESQNLRALRVEGPRGLACWAGWWGRHRQSQPPGVSLDLSGLWALSGRAWHVSLVVAVRPRSRSYRGSALAPPREAAPDTKGRGLRAANASCRSRPRAKHSLATLRSNQ